MTSPPCIRPWLWPANGVKIKIKIKIKTKAKTTARDSAREN
jgi:hypothetical protein